MPSAEAVLDIQEDSCLCNWVGMMWLEFAVDLRLEFEPFVAVVVFALVGIQVDSDSCNWMDKVKAEDAV